MKKLSAIIITLNEEKNIERCIASIKKIADEIIVVDSFSTDHTKQICEKQGVKFYQAKWLGYSDTKNFAASLASNCWIISIDADEVLDEELIDSIKMAKNNINHDVYSFNRITNYCGKYIKHGGWYPDVKVRLYNKSTDYWEGTIHEKLITIKQPILLKGHCLHYSYNSIEDHYKQIEKYTDYMAKELSKKKIYAISLFLKPAFRFIRDYFFKLGFLDGKEGFTIAKISAWGVYLKYKKALALNTKL